MPVPVRIKRFPQEIKKRLWRPRWLWAVPAALAYDWWVSPWLEGTVKPWLEEKAGLVPKWALFFADRPWLIPVVAVSITLIAVIVHAYASAGQATAAEMADLKRQIEILVADNRELAMQQVQARTEAAPEAVAQAVEDLRAAGRIRLRSTAKGQVIQAVGQATETDQAMPITHVKGPPSDRGPVTHRESGFRSRWLVH